MSLGPTDRDVDDVTGGTHYKMYLYILQIIFLSNLQIAVVKIAQLGMHRDTEWDMTGVDAPQKGRLQLQRLHVVAIPHMILDLSKEQG